MKSTKGFILTLDAVLALFIAMAIFLAIYDMSSESSINSRDYIYSFVVDFLTVSEKDDALRLVVEGNSTYLNDFLHAQQDNLCLNVSVYSDDYTKIFSNSTPCPEPTWNVVYKRSFVLNTSFYMAEVEAWYK